MGSLVKKLLRRVISWAYPGSPSKPVGGGVIMMKDDPAMRKALDDFVHQMKEESRRRGRP